MRRSRSNLVIKERNPWKVFFWVAFAVFIFVAGITMAVEVSYREGEVDGSIARGAAKTLHARLVKSKEAIVSYKAQNIKLKTEIARLESLNRIDGHAYKRIKTELKTFHNKNQKLREEIQFYIRIVSPRKGNAGLRIHSFKIDPGLKKRLFIYRLILVQIHGLKNRHRSVSGTFRVYVLGKRLDGSKRVLRLRDVMPVSDQAELKFSLKYYESIEGSMELPDGFVPTGIRVQLIPNSRSRSGRRSVEKRVPWPLRAG